MIHLTLAIASFMRILIEAVLWVGARFAGYGLIAIAVIVIPAWVIRALVRRHRR